MDRPLRVSVWGAGNVGAGCIRELLRLKEYELVSVLVATPEKHGRDVGDLLALGHKTGVLATTDKEAFLNEDVDCVLYAGMPPIAPDEMDADMFRLLETGRNVVSNTAYHYPPFHGPDYVARIEAACRKGGTRLHGTGENPGFMLERMAMTLTGLCNSVEQIKVTEFVDCGKLANAGTITFFGFGVPKDSLQGGTPLENLFAKFMFVESLSLVCQAIFGRMPDAIKHEPTYVETDKPIKMNAMTIQPGTVGYISHRFSAMLDGKARVVNEVHWYMWPENKPDPSISSNDHWRFEIEGKPCSMRTSMDLYASLEGDRDQYEGDPTSQTYYATAATMIQAIPHVCAGKPGIVYASVFGHTTPDQRKLATEASIVG